MLPSLYQILPPLLDKYGIQQTWRELLTAWIDWKSRHGNPALSYILSDKNFITAKKIIDLKNLKELKELGDYETWLRCYEFSLAHCNKTARKKSGQYFTPPDIADVMAEKAITHFGKDHKKIWCDPACGIGNLVYPLIKKQKNPEGFLQNNLLLIDKDPLALLIARTLLTIQFQHKNNNLFYDIEKNFICMDFLSDNNPKLAGFDYALFNPPYGKLLTNDSEKFYGDYQTKTSCDLYALFMERVIKTMRCGFVALSPQSFTHAKKFASLRKLLLERGQKIHIYNFDNVPDSIFRGKKFGSSNSNQANSTRAAITIFHHKNNINPDLEFAITPLLRWRSGERQIFLQNLDDFLTPLKNPDDHIFPKIGKDESALYHKVKTYPPLKTIIVHQPTDYCLFIPSTPRYFISALTQKPNRTSCRLLYFNNQKNCNLAYMLINSSFCYWWWRLHDGGMTLSSETLLSLPLLDAPLKKRTLIDKLQESEKINIVKKKNAGKYHENVKHPATLLTEINTALLGLSAKELLRIHNNSHLLDNNHVIG